MANIKVIVELKVPENFKPCENNRQIFEQYECPFAYDDCESGCNACGFDVKDCPMKSMKVVK